MVRSGHSKTVVRAEIEECGLFRTILGRTASRADSERCCRAIPASPADD
jgi:hypothetical protein